MKAYMQLEVSDPARFTAIPKSRPGMQGAAVSENGGRRRGWCGEKAEEVEKPSGHPQPRRNPRGEKGHRAENKTPAQSPSPQALL